jgi:hypothetical protein
MKLSPLQEAIRAAEEFVRWARYHQDRPQPERLEQVRRATIEKLHALKIDTR